MTSLEGKVWDEFNQRQQECCAPECGIIENPQGGFEEMPISDHERREIFLDNVSNLINGEREQDYGRAIENFGRIARMWSAYFGDDITVHDVAACLAMLKIARLATSPTKRDSWLDLAGYATLGGTL